MKTFILYALLIQFSLFFTIQGQEKAELIIYNANIYTVDNNFSKAEALAVSEGKFVAIGTSQEILENFTSGNQIDAQGKAIYPGFYDAHCHFYRYAQALREVNLVGTESFEEVLERIQKFREKYPNQAWIVGMGWDQNDWEIKEFPDRKELDSLFPETPVLLRRIDGHAALVNEKALTSSRVSKYLKVSGGVIETQEGEMTGILVDNAIGLVASQIPPLAPEQMKSALLEAQENCFAVGLTTVSDAGLNFKHIQEIQSLQEGGELKMRIYIMLSANAPSFSKVLENGIIETTHLTLRSIKVYADGALGSRGACLLKPYNDRPKETGFLLNSAEEMQKLFEKSYQSGFQVNTHCIGDSANRLVLDLYGQFLEENNDLRWRIEHAQVVHANDLEKYAQYKVIPSVQPTHCTSDMYWADERLGEERLKDAYVFKDLLIQNNLIALGTDFPVENINPLYTFHSAVARQDAENYPENGFQMENALTREEALKGMTIWAAYANFEEKERGSIEVGKFADFVILEKDIMEIPLSEIRETKVLSTFLGGENVFEKK